jgi:Na+/proline symporter
MLAYFGCDQSQVQRILTNPTADESRKALLLSAFAKVPMQAGVLFIGVLLYLFYVLNPAPLFFDPTVEAAAVGSPRIAAEVQELAQRYAKTNLVRRAAAREVAAQGVDGVNPATLSRYRQAVAAAAQMREQARRLAFLDKDENRGLDDAALEAVKTPADTNYIFPFFLLREVPVVLLGLMMAAIFAAMMSSADSALNSLTSSTVVDLYQRWLRPAATEDRAMFISRLTTLFWGLAATVAALAFEGTGSVIVLVNKIGSYFYGSLLGVFVLGLFVRRAGASAGFLGLLGGMVAVLVTDLTLRVSFLWYNVIGCVGVLVVGGLVSLIERPAR